MNDKISPEVNHQTDEHEDFDPLAELARIVAGETEQTDNDQQTSEFPIEEETLFAPDDMEAELMRQLEQTQLAEDPTTQMDATGEPKDDLSAQVSSINELDASLDKMDDNLAGFVVPAAPLQPQEVSTEEPQPLETGDFQNDLIDALQSELDDSVAAEQTAVEQDDDTSLAEELAIDDAAIENAEEVEEEISFEEEMALIIEGSDQEDLENDPIEGIDPNEDLGEAFLNEFESRVGYTNTVHVSEPEIETEPKTEPVLELDAEPSVSMEAETSPELELDFEAAFSEELGLGASFDEDLEQDDLTSIAAIEQTSEPRFEDDVNLDPGHSGEIPVDAPYQKEEKSGGVKYAVVAIIVALLAGAGVAIYGFVGDGKSLMLTETPVIEAIKSAYKTKPENPGGKVVDNQDNATYAEVEGVGNQNSGQTNLVSDTEEPAILDQSALESSKSTERLSNTEQGESAGATQNAVVKPRVVQIQTVKPDGTIIASSPVSSTANKVEEQLKLASNQALQLATEVKTVATKVIEPLKPLDGAKTTNKIVAPTVSPKEKPAGETNPTAVAVPEKRPAKPAATTTQVANVVQPTTQTDNQPTVLPSVQPETTQAAAPATPSSTWVVQVSSSPSQQEAQSSYNRMARKYPVIQGRSTNIVSAQVNGRTYYRLRLNTASKSDASNLCSQLKASGGDCFITR